MAVCKLAMLLDFLSVAHAASTRQLSEPPLAARRECVFTGCALARLCVLASLPAARLKLISWSSSRLDCAQPARPLSVAATSAATALAAAAHQLISSSANTLADRQTSCQLLQPDRRPPPPPRRTLAGRSRAGRALCTGHRCALCAAGRKGAQTANRQDAVLFVFLPLCLLAAWRAYLRHCQASSYIRRLYTCFSSTKPPLLV